MYEEMLGVVEEVLGGRVLGVVVFGSSVYMGCGRDIDVLVVVDGGLEPREKLRLEAELARRLRARPGCLAFDVHVLGMEDFRANLEPGASYRASPSATRCCSTASASRTRYLASWRGSRVRGTYSTTSMAPGT